MAVETHWICDVCGNRMIDRGKTKNVNETKIQDWFVITVNVRRISEPIPGRQANLYSYACSQECYEKAVENMKDAAYKQMYQAVKEV